MEKTTVKALVAVFLGPLTLFLLFFQLLYFAFGILNQSTNDPPLPVYYTYAHLFTFVVLIWFGVYVLRRALCESTQIKTLWTYPGYYWLRFPYRIMLILLGALSLYYQSEIFIFEYSISRDIFLVALSILIIVWFIVHQIKLFIRTCNQWLLDMGGK